MKDDFPHVDGVEHRFVQAGGVRLHVAEAGAGDPVLMLHGWPQHWYSWRLLIPLLADRYRLICPDLRGFGWSEAPGHGYDPETFASDAVALLDALEIERAHVIGHDWGGYTSLLLATHHARRVRKAIALNAPHDHFPRTPALLGEVWRVWYVLLMASPWLGAAILRRRPGLIAWMQRADNVHDGISKHDAMIYARRLTEPQRARASTLLYRSYLRRLGDLLHPTRDPVPVAVPARLLFGARDLAISKRLVAGFENAGEDCALELIPDSGHFLPEEKPELVAQRAREFFG